MLVANGKGWHIIEIGNFAVIDTANCVALDLCSNQVLNRCRHTTKEVVVEPDFFIASADSVIVTDSSV
eukprot:scaffold21835_cov80-Skeletonema_marinoi.AAC.1